MKFNATVDLDKVRVLELLTQALKAQGLQVSHQDIEFKIEAVECGTQRDPWVVYDFAGIKIKNIRVGEE